MTNHELLDDVLAQLQDYGLKPETPLVIGKRTRCECDGDKAPEKTGWYVIYDHLTGGKTLYCGAFGDWRQGEKGSWQKIKVKGGRLSAEDRAVMRARAEEGQRKAAEAGARKHRTAARRAAGMWKHLEVKGHCAYLDAKRVAGFGLRYKLKSGCALVPMRSVKTWEVIGLQVLFPEVQPKLGRNKTYWPAGLEKEGAVHLIGPEPEPGDVILVCEGYATGASLHMATALTVAVCFDAGNLLPVAQGLRVRYPGRPLLFCADDDWKTQVQGKPFNTGKVKAENAAVVVGGQVVLPIFDNDREAGWTDFNDLHCAEGLDAVRRQVLALVRPATDAGWHEKLLRSAKGGILAHPYNVGLILGNDSRWSGVIAWDSFASKIIKARTPPFGGSAGDWEDIDDIKVMMWLAEVYGLSVKSPNVFEAVNSVAHDNAFHPVREYLDGLVWDGAPRLERWLQDRLGVADSEYTRKVGKRWLLSAVARVFRPGCKVDVMLILEGLQGEGKSTAAAVLAGKWFMDTAFDMSSKDAYQAIRGKWIIEMAELDALNKSDTTKAKQFVSSATDHYRESYGRRHLSVPRQSVFIGTTNQDEYLKDDTGNRRYWPVTCTKVDLDGLRAERDQLWAEAVACFRAGDIWWAEREENELFAAEQDKRFQADMWEEPVVHYLAAKHIGETVTGAHLLQQALNIDPSHWGRPEQMRIGKIMHRLKWPRRRQTSGHGGVRGYEYVKPVNWKRGTVEPRQETAF
ncbi:conjugal transfer protein TraC [Pseudomonas marginalis]|uniref:Conjugal transfer protein TraC n=2 Tax=Gammaproteobacteria TaxID=1236 RepID=A0A9X9BSE6_PSEMA|nr:conjugal transfer protein TraC [Pseudomonas marginalis]SED26964.1 putative DNA primase/helicase [Pseudomonas marginalis]